MVFMMVINYKTTPKRKSGLPGEAGNTNSEGNNYNPEIVENLSERAKRNLSRARKKELSRLIAGEAELESLSTRTSVDKVLFYLEGNRYYFEADKDILNEINGFNHYPTSPRNLSDEVDYFEGQTGD